MSAEQLERFYVLELFREFCAEVLRFKHELEASAAPPAGADGGESLDDVVGAADLGGGEPVDPVLLQSRRAEFVRGELLALMNRQSQDVLRRGDEREQRRFREVQYVMAAMADEVLLNLNWPGKEHFATNLIEEEVFHTHDAGTRFFANLDELLRLRDPTRAEVAAAYLLAISLGFRGKHREVESQARLEYYRQQLFALLFQRNPGLSDDVQIYPQAYAYTLSGQQTQWLPLLRPWLLGIAGVALGYLALSHIVWVRGSSSVATIVERMHARERPPVLTPPIGPQAEGPPPPLAQPAREAASPPSPSPATVKQEIAAMPGPRHGNRQVKHVRSRGHHR